MAIRKPAGADDQMEMYEEQLQTLCAQALAGRITKSEFKREMLDISTASTLIMFLTGGGDPKNPYAVKWLAKQKAIHRKSTKQLANDIYSGRYSDEGGDSG